MMSDAITQRYFEDVWPGDEYIEEHQPTGDDVAEYLHINQMGRRAQTGNLDGRFTDVAGAARQGLARPIVPGAMSMALITRLVTDWMGPLGHLRSIEVSFRRPVQHDDRLRANALVTDASDEDGEPTATLDVFFENERGERPVQGTAVVVLPRRTQPAPVVE
ncbi:MAG: hypothetical protein DWG74_01630 [Chloroflexi bacterium]|nr:hypothetical protein [Chloroflexota bacterium]